MVMVKGKDRNGFGVYKVEEAKLCVCGVARCGKNCKSAVKCLGLYFT